MGVNIDQQQILADIKKYQKYKFVNYNNYSDKDKKLLQNVWFYIADKKPKENVKVKTPVYRYCYLLNIINEKYGKPEKYNNEYKTIDNAYIVFIGLENAINKLLHNGSATAKDKLSEPLAIKRGINKNNASRIINYVDFTLKRNDFTYLSLADYFRSLIDFVPRNGTMNTNNDYLSTSLILPIASTLICKNLTDENIKELSGRIKDVKVELQNPSESSYLGYFINTFYGFIEQKILSFTGMMTKGSSPEIIIKMLMMAFTAWTVYNSASWALYYGTTYDSYASVSFLYFLTYVGNILNRFGLKFTPHWNYIFGGVMVTAPILTYLFS